MFIIYFVTRICENVKILEKYICVSFKLSIWAIVTTRKHRITS
jgi:hypothetical protein